MRRTRNAKVARVEQMIAMAGALARRAKFAAAGETFVAVAGLPFGTPGSTNLLRIGVA